LRVGRARVFVSHAASPSLGSTGVTASVGDGSETI
jgi:hypothetical protein